MAGGVAQGEGPEFKPHYRKMNKQKPHKNTSLFQPLATMNLPSSSVDLSFRDISHRWDQVVFTLHI
jgi:hypothetical protein